MSRRVEVICAQKYTLSNGALSKYKFGGALEGKPTTFVLCVDADGDLRVLDNGKQNDFHLYVQEGPSRHRNERLVIAAKEDDAYLWHLRRVRHISRLPPPGKSNIYVFFRKDAGFPDGFYRAGLAYTVEEVRLPYHPSHHALTRLRDFVSCRRVWAWWDCRAFALCRRRHSKCDARPSAARRPFHLPPLSAPVPVISRPLIFVMIGCCDPHTIWGATSSR